MKQIFIREKKELRLSNNIEIVSELDERIHGLTYYHTGLLFRILFTGG